MPPDDDFSPTGALPKVLIVEDNTDIAFYISTVLGSTYSTFFAMEGEEALRKSADIMPDIILTDVMMPGMNGLELCRKIKQSHVTNHIPIIVITAKTEERDKMEALEAGADAFLVKPFNARELVLRIGNLMAQRRRLVQRQNVAGTEQSGQIAGLKETEQQFVNKLTDLICANMKNSDMNAVLLAEHGQGAANRGLLAEQLHHASAHEPRPTAAETDGQDHRRGGNGLRIRRYGLLRTCFQEPVQLHSVAIPQDSQSGKRRVRNL